MGSQERPAEGRRETRTTACRGQEKQRMGYSTDGGVGGRPPPRMLELPLPRWLTPLRPFIHVAQRVPASVHVKLLAGFLVGVLLLLGSAALDVVVVERMSSRVDDVNRAQRKVDLARRMEYLVTVQMHYR